MDPKQLETAARHACKLLGLDPDANVPGESGSCARKHHQLLAPRVREQWAINSALMEACAGVARFGIAQTYTMGEIETT